VERRQSAFERALDRPALAGSGAGLRTETGATTCESRSGRIARTNGSFAISRASGSVAMTLAAFIQRETWRTLAPVAATASTYREGTGTSSKSGA